MSYILEALKRSQTERELARVPTLEAATLSIEDHPVSRGIHWAMVAAGCAALAVAVAVYAMLRMSDGQGALARGPGGAEAPVSAATGHSPARIDQAAGPAPVALNPADPDVAQLPSRPLSLPYAAVTQPSAVSPVPDLSTGAVQPMPASPAPRPVEAPLVEAPPPKKGGVLSHRDMAVIPGRGATPPPVPAVLNDMDTQWEQQLERQLGSDPATAPIAQDLAGEQVQQGDGPTPVPVDLIADIDAFKQRVKGGRGLEQGKDPGVRPASDDAHGTRTGRAVQPATPLARERSPGVLATPERQGLPPLLNTPPERAEAKGPMPRNPPTAQPDPVPPAAVPSLSGTPAQRAIPGREDDPSQLRLTPEQQASLPKFQMSVHVYNLDPSRRFILINGLKYGEGAKTREGLKVAEIRLDGAVLDYQGHPFFIHR